MISVLILGFSTASTRPATSGDAVRTLSALVSGTVEGIVRDVCLLAFEPDVELDKVADYAGCGIVKSSTFTSAILEGAKQARCPLLLILPSGVTFDRAFTDEVAMVISEPAGARRERAYRLKSFEAGMAGRIFPQLAPDAGLLAPRDSVISIAAQDFPALIRACRPLRSFKVKAWTGD
jgi:hypothetical protein